VGGIEAEAAMLGQPVSMLLPQVVGLKLLGEMREGTTATDLVLTVAETLRKTGVVGKFVEVFGPGMRSVSLATRATIGNMSPEYGCTVTMSPIDVETLDYLRFTGRSADHVALVEAYAKAQGMWHDSSVSDPEYSQVVELDLSSIEPSIAGPKRPQDRISLSSAKHTVESLLEDPSASVQQLTDLDSAISDSFPASDPTEGDDNLLDAKGPRGACNCGTVHNWPSNRQPMTLNGVDTSIDNGDVVIAAITSCTNTSNPSVMMAAGLLAKKAVERGLEVKPWVKTSLAPGSKVVADYYESSGLLPYLEKLRFNVVGYGCTTCIGNSGPLAAPISEAVNDSGLAVVSVLSGNRNFEGRINPDVRMNYLMSPPLVVAYALAGTMDIDLVNDPLGTGSDGSPVYLRDIWPSSAEVSSIIGSALQSDMFRTSYADVFKGDERWAALDVPTGDRYEWSDSSTYIRRAPYFDDMPAEPAPVAGISGARVLALLGDSVTTDHISPAGNIRKDGPAGSWLLDHSVDQRDFNSYGSRRGNHEVMIRGTFANIRIRNQLVPGVEGGYTVHLPDGEQMSIYDAAMAYQRDGVPLVVLAGKEYGSGSSRDWAAKGTFLLGVRAVIAESFERIHRSNLIGMGVLPLQFRDGESASSLGLTGREVFSVSGLDPLNSGTTPREVTVTADDTTFTARLRIDTPKEADYYRHGGILQYVLRQLRG
jgi:aconitate hydratase